MTCETSGKSRRLKSWQLSAIVIFILAAGVGAGVPLGVMIVRDDADTAIQEIRKGYADASDARMQTLNLCLANQGKSAIVASEAARVAGEAASAAAKAVDAASAKTDAASNP